MKLELERKKLTKLNEDYKFAIASKNREIDELLVKAE
jgi:hypothetical protein